MTKHFLNPYSDDITEVTVGLDRRRHTYFARVFTETSDGEEELAVELGLIERIEDPQAVLDAIRPYAPIPDRILEYLLHDWVRADQNTPIEW